MLNLNLKEIEYSVSDTEGVPKTDQRLPVASRRITSVSASPGTNPNTTEPQPLPENFQSDESNIRYAKKQGLNLEEELTLFMELHGSIGNERRNWQKVFRKWLIDASPLRGHVVDLPDWLPVKEWNQYLAVVCQQVVPVETGTADGRSVIQTSMRAMPVVLMEPARELESAGLRVVVRAAVGPFPESGLDEAFGFAVGAWSVRTSEALANTELLAELAKMAGAIAGTVIGEHAGDGDAESSIVVNGSLQEGGSRGSFLVGQDLREGNAGVVVDSDMHVLPAGAMDAAASVAGDATTDGLETSDLLDIEVEQIARSGMFIAHDGHSRFQISNATEVKSAQDAADGGTTSSDRERDAESGPALAAQPLDQVDLLGRAAKRRAQRTGRPILQTRTPLLLKTADPTWLRFWR